MARFSLRQLLTFLFACCVYVGVVRAVIVAIEPSEFTIVSTWYKAVILAGAWLLLAVLYWRWRLLVAMFVHSAASPLNRSRIDWLSSSSCHPPYALSKHYSSSSTNVRRRVTLSLGQAQVRRSKRSKPGTQRPAKYHHYEFRDSNENPR